MVVDRHCATPTLVAYSTEGYYQKPATVGIFDGGRAGVIQYGHCGRRRRPGRASGSAKPRGFCLCSEHRHYTISPCFRQKDYGKRHELGTSILPVSGVSGRLWARPSAQKGPATNELAHSAPASYPQRETLTIMRRLASMRKESDTMQTMQYGH